MTRRTLQALACVALLALALLWPWGDSPLRGPALVSGDNIQAKGLPKDTPLSGRSRVVQVSGRLISLEREEVNNIEQGAAEAFGLVFDALFPDHDRTEFGLPVPSASIVSMYDLRVATRTEWDMLSDACALQAVAQRCRVVWEADYHDSLPTALARVISLLTDHGLNTPEFWALAHTLDSEGADNALGSREIPDTGATEAERKICTMIEGRVRALMNELRPPQ